MTDKKLIELFKERQKETLIEAQAIKKRFFDKKIRVLGINGSARSKNDFARENLSTE